MGLVPLVLVGLGEAFEIIVLLKLSSAIRLGAMSRLKQGYPPITSVFPLLTHEHALFRGDVNATVLDVLGGIRSACTYTGAKRLKELKKCVTFIQVTQQLNEVFSGQTTGD